MRRAALGFLDVGNAEDDERPSFVIVIARALIFISNVVNEIIRDFEVVNQKILVGWGRSLAPSSWAATRRECAVRGCSSRMYACCSSSMFRMTRHVQDHLTWGRLPGS